MRNLACPGWMMTLSKRQDGYLNHQVILFRLQYKTHSLQMYPESLWKSVVAPTPNLSERKYALRLVVVPSQYFSSPFPFFQPILPSLSSHISYIAVQFLLCWRINPFCPTSPPLCSSAAVFAAELVCHPHCPGATIRPQVVSHSLLIFAHFIAVLPIHFAISAVPHIICCRPTYPLPPYPFMLSCISATIIVRSCLQRWPCLPSLLSCISTVPPLLSSRVSVAVLIVLSSIFPCTLTPLFV